MISSFLTNIFVEFLVYVVANYDVVPYIVYYELIAGSEMVAIIKNALGLAKHIKRMSKILII